MFGHDPERADRFGGWLETLSTEEGGGLILVLWFNALLTVALQVGSALLIWRAARRLRRDGPDALGSLARSPATVTMVALQLTHRVVRRLIVRWMNRRGAPSMPAR